MKVLGATAAQRPERDAQVATVNLRRPTPLFSRCPCCWFQMGRKGAGANSPTGAQLSEHASALDKHKASS